MFGFDNFFFQIIFDKNSLALMFSPDKSMDSDKLKMLKINNLVVTIPANWKLSIEKVQIYLKLKVSWKCGESGNIQNLFISKLNKKIGHFYATLVSMDRSILYC